MTRRAQTSTVPESEVRAAVAAAVLPILKKHQARLDEVRSLGFFADSGARLHDVRAEVAKALEARGWFVHQIANFMHRHPSTMFNTLGRTNRIRDRQRASVVGTADNFMAHVEKLRGGCVSHKGAKLLVAEIHRLRAIIGAQHADQ